MNVPTHTRETRTDLEGMVQYYAGGQNGVGHWVNLSRTGAAVHLGRYLRPGRLITLQIPAAGAEGFNVLLEAKVAWCRRAGETGEFLAGVQLLRNEPIAALAAAMLLQEAREAETNKQRTVPVFIRAWPRFECPVDEQTLKAV